MTVTGETRNPLTAIVQSRSIPHGLTRRAQIVLMFADGIRRRDRSTPRAVPADGPEVRDRFVGQGLMGLYEELRPGAPASSMMGLIALLIRQTLDSKPEGSTPVGLPIAGHEQDLEVHRAAHSGRFSHSAPSAKATSSSPPTPSLSRCAISSASISIRPTRPWCSCVDEKRHPGWSARNPCCAGEPGYVEGVTHDYVRHGTTTLLQPSTSPAASAVTQCKPRHRHQEFLAFLETSR